MRKHKKKRWKLFLLILALVVTLSVSFDQINLQLYNTPFFFEQIAHQNSKLLGVWKADFGYFHDCSGCETKNTMLLSINSDSSATIIYKIHNLKYLTYIPIIDKFYAVPEKEFANYSYNYTLRNDCLIEFSDTANYVYDFFAVFEYCAKYTSQIENPVYAYKVEWNKDYLILTD
ncbi:MAG: hypothetical protein JJ971_08535 [Balneolaceae bacterium]|nr:hypothetical protein [Balneolaceae bacterium]MBO6546714.1 hypothetical protein [Balneolaceae bacterium]MBO6649072.1 hypothetical protein [Balneolaceae bacterium]